MARMSKEEEARYYLELEQSRGDIEANIAKQLPALTIRELNLIRCTINELMFGKVRK